MFVSETDLVNFLIALHRERSDAPPVASDAPSWANTEQRYNELYFERNNPFYSVNDYGEIVTHRNIFCIGYRMPRGKICDGGKAEAIAKLKAAGLIEFGYSFGHASKGWTLPEFRPTDM